MTARSIPIPPAESTHLFTFRLARQVFAFPVAPIRQIVEMVTITPLVKAGDPVVGVINVRGQTVLVVDMRRLFHLPVPPLGLHTPILLVESRGQVIGLIVDTVQDVLELAAGQVDDPSRFLPPGMGELPVLKGIIRAAAGPAVLLDPDHLFDPGQAEALHALAELSLDQPSIPAVPSQTSQHTSPDPEPCA